MKNIISINGGGVFGCGVANWLTKLHPAWQPDLAAGTSVGSILAGLIGMGKSYKTIAELFNGNLVKRIFTKPGFPKNILPTGYTYDNAEARKVLKEVFGEWKVNDCKVPVLIVAWNYTKKKAKVFSYRHNGDYLLRDAILASISAPTYFPIVELKDPLNGEKCQYGDGGVCMNNPSMAAIASLRESGIKIKEIRCLNLNTAGWPGEKNISPGSALAWLPVIIDIVTLGNGDAMSFCASQILEDRFMQISPAMPNGKLDDIGLIPKIKNAWLAEPADEAIMFLNGSPPVLP
jgi:patatin-like phospholipase/acyl hydrolase